MKNLYLVEGVSFYLVKGVGFYLVKGFIHYPGEIVSGGYRRRWLMDEGCGQRSMPNSFSRNAFVSIASLPKIGDAPNLW